MRQYLKRFLPLAQLLSQNPWHMGIISALYALLLLTLPRLPLYVCIAIVLPVGFVGWFVSRAFWIQAIRENNRRMVIGALNHHFGNALTILSHRDHLNPETRESVVDDACARMLWAVREVLPSLTRDTPLDSDPFDNGASK